jgi:hypothetical protein
MKKNEDIDGIVDGETEYGKEFPIQPGDIYAKNLFWGAFNHHETEVSSLLIVQFCQERGGWIPFSKEEIDVFCKEDFWFNGLTEPWIILGKDGRYRVTDGFIFTCKVSADRNERQKCGG